MNKHSLDIAFVALATACLAAFIAGGCQSEPVAPQLPMVAQQPVAPPVAPVAEPVAPPAPEPPATPLTPIVEEAPAAKTGSGVGTGICKSIPGATTPGDEILGNYSCQLTDMQLPFGLTPPAFDCALRRQGDGSIRIMPSGGAAALNGPITETKTGGFRLDATWTYPGIKLRVGSCMMRKGTGFKGSGSGILNDDKSKKTKFKLTMTRK